MEHPYLLFVKIFDMMGLGHFAHDYKHVIYSWVVMIILVVVGALAAKNVSIIPSRLQNFFEIVIAGIEDFMISITGEEGRWFFPLAATIAIYVFFSNLMGLIPGFFPPT
ncbi:MAG: F0F1 ATP synthase subunit A, partial [Desulfosudaceae bacterium]